MVLEELLVSVNARSCRCMLYPGPVTCKIRLLQQQCRCGVSRIRDMACTKESLPRRTELQVKCIGDDALSVQQSSSWAFPSLQTDVVHDVDGHQATGSSVRMYVCLGLRTWLTGVQLSPTDADRVMVMVMDRMLSADRLLHGLPDVIVCSGWCRMSCSVSKLQAKHVL